MANERRAPPHDLTWLDRLRESPSEFDFHVALRRFDATYESAPRSGEAESPKREVVRIGQTPFSSFEPHQLMSFDVPEDGSKPRLTVGFLGLWGPNGPLPSHMTEYARERIRHVGDATMSRFVDVFHHRMLLLFHRAWAKSQQTVAMDRPDSDDFALYVGSLFGLGLQSTRHRDAADDFVKLYNVGWLSASARNADGLRDIVSDHFGLPARIEEFVGEWLDLPADSRWRLGESPETGALGRTIVLGNRVMSRTHKFRVALGPLSAFEFDQMLPHSDAIASLAALVRLYTNDEWDWELALTVASASVKPLQLGGGGRLGWTTRIGSGDADVDVELVVDPALRRTRRVERSAVRSKVEGL